MCPYIQVVIPSYLLMAFVGGFVSLVFLYFRIEKAKLLFSDFLKIFIVGILGIVTGSKLLFALTQIPWLIRNFSLENLLLLIPESGYVFYGGLFGLIFALWIYTKKEPGQRENVFRFIVPAMPLFHMFGRIGCFMAGCCYGKVLENPIVIGGMKLYHVPVQLIEAAFELLIFIVIIILDKKKEKVNLLKWYLVMYAIVRFLLEFLRGDALRGIFLGISTSQCISIIVLIYYLIKTIRAKKKS